MKYFYVFFFSFPHYVASSHLTLGRCLLTSFYSGKHFLYAAWDGFFTTLSLNVHQIQPQKFWCKGHRTFLVYCKVWLVFGPGKSLFNHIQWSNKLVSFEPLKITLLHFFIQVLFGIILLNKCRYYCSNWIMFRKANKKRIRDN